MARKTETVTITESGRDENKQFLLTEMPATQAERFATQCLFLLSQSGANIPESAEGMAGLASVAIGGLPALRALQDPSLDAWKECVQFTGHKIMPQKIFWDSPSCQIEEVRTLGLLRMKVLELHLSPFLPASNSISA